MLPFMNRRARSVFGTRNIKTPAKLRAAPKPPSLFAALFGGAILLLPQFALAQSDFNSGDTSWMIVATVLVLLMTLPGLALFYGGLVRAVNVISVLMHCYAIACVASVLWLIVGYSLAFGDGGAMHRWIGGLDKVMLSGVDGGSLSGSIPETVFFMFQMTFAIITPALIVGAYVERIKFSHVLIMSSLWLLVVYAPVTHWIWGGGFLGDMGVLDFAGGLVVHATAGTSAVVIVALLGSRRSFPHHLEPPHNPGLTVIGASLLWVGWFGFNAGSALVADGSAGMAMVVTHISAATASLVWLLCEWIRFGKPSLIGTVTGTIAGLATVTPAAGFIGPVGGLICGLAGGFGCYYAVHLIRNRIGLDDSLDVFAVHGVGGLLGTLLIAPLATELFAGGGLDVSMLDQLGRQVTGALVVVGWSIAATFVIVLVVRLFFGLRVDTKAEAEGLDYAAHGERSYNL